MTDSLPAGTNDSPADLHTLVIVQDEAELFFGGKTALQRELGAVERDLVRIGAGEAAKLSDDKSSTMPVITVQLPWAAALRAGVKLVENRGQQISRRYIGQQIGIHASATFDRGGGADELIRSWWWAGTPDRGPVDATDFTHLFRKVIAVGTLTGVHQADTSGGVVCCAPWGMPFYNGRTAWHHTFTDMIVLPEPVPARGQVLLPWTLDADRTALVRTQLAALVAA